MLVAVIFWDGSLHCFKFKCIKRDFTVYICMRLVFRVLTYNNVRGIKYKRECFFYYLLDENKNIKKANYFST